MNKDMAFKEFINAILKEVKKTFPDAEINDGALLIRSSADSRLSARVSGYGLYETFLGSEMSIKELADKTVEKLKQDDLVFKGFNGAVHDIRNFDAVENKLVVKAVPLAKCYGDVIFNQYNTIDIGVVLNIYLGESDNNNMLFAKPTKKILDTWGISEDEAFKIAFDNTKKLFGVEIKALNDFLKAMVGDDTGEYESNDGYVYCVTHKKHANGAILMFDEEVQRQVYELVGGDYYVCFTSIHEAMIHPKTLVGKDTLKEILVETVKEATAPEDFLTYTVYEYSDSYLS